MIIRYLCEQFDNIDVYGIEFSDSIYKAQRMVVDLGFKADLIKLDMNNGMPCDMIGKFDLVMSFGLIEHFKTPEKILRTMSTLLVDGGGCMLTLIPNFEGFFNLLWKYYDGENYSSHVPISKSKLLDLHEGLDLRMLECIGLGNPILPGIHNHKSLLLRLANKIIVNINGRIFQRLVPKQVSLEKSYYLSPVVACWGNNKTRDC